MIERDMTLSPSPGPGPGPGPDTPLDLDIEDVFPFDEPYAAQRDVMGKLAELFDAGGIACFEGACGSGKTLGALVPALKLVRNPDTQFERVVAVTSVKQQLRAFEDDGKAINANLPDDAEPFTGLSLVGKADLCPYAAAGEIDTDGFYSACDTVCNPVRLAARNAPGPDETAKQMQDMARNGRANDGEAPLAGESWMSPYMKDFPESSDDNEYCPMYAEARRMGAGEDIGWRPDGIYTPQELLAHGAENGACPHALMRQGLAESDLLIANYYHIFDPMTVERMTGSIIGPETLLIVDEAHGLVENVRDLLSDNVSRWGLDRALNETERVQGESVGESFEDAIRVELAESDISMDDVRAFEAFLRAVARWMDDRATRALDDADGAWLEKFDDLPTQIEQGLRDPGTAEPDEFSEWVDGDEYPVWGGEDEQQSLTDIGKGIAEVLTEAAEEANINYDETFVDTVGRVLGRWKDKDHEEYFRQFVLDRRENPWKKEDGWQAKYRARLEIKNCIPSEAISARLDAFGAVTLMSATLEPIDVYREVVGIDQLADERPVENYVYGLGFPEENRESLAVRAEPYTSSNRGGTAARWRDDDQDAVRDQYASIVTDVVTTTPGNVLVAMPSYDEADWIGGRLERNSDVEKPILIDESSSEAATERLKDRFFAGDGKVLCTGLRGTLTEGVDYDGDRLAGAVVCGVPIRGLGGDYPDAIQMAYESKFGSSNGFEYAFTVPAARKARQAIGRVIRGDGEVGVRVFADARYSDHRWNGVRDYLPEYAQVDFTPAEPGFVKPTLERFWSTVRERRQEQDQTGDPDDAEADERDEGGQDGFTFTDGGSTDETDDERPAAAEAQAVAGPPTAPAEDDEPTTESGPATLDEF